MAQDSRSSEPGAARAALGALRSARRPVPPPAIRGPIPTGLVPTCCKHHRLGALSHIEYLVAVDAWATCERMVSEGWSVADISDSIGGHARSLAGSIEAASRSGAALWLGTHGAGA